MFGPMTFEQCVRKNLENKGYGDKRAKDIMKRLAGLQKHFEAAGQRKPDAQMMAMARLFAELADQTKEKAKRTIKTLEVQAANADRIAQGANADTSIFLLDGKPGSKGVAYARAAVSLLESDPRFQGTSYSSVKEATRGQLWSIMADVLDKFGKGLMGVQRGKAHLDNVVRELFGEQTGDLAAQQIAKAYTKTQELGVDLFNAAGGSMKKLRDYRLPQGQSAVKLTKAGFDEWADVHRRTLDWGNMRWPDGSPIDPADYDSILRNVYDTLSTNGASKVDPKSMRGQGAAVGNALEQHRFLKYKDAASWLEVHNKYSDGNVFDVVVSHVEDMSHKIALVQTFGPNPELAAQNLHALVRKAAASEGGRAVADAEAVLKNKFDPMFDVITRDNPMDPHSSMGGLVTGASNVLASAMLGAASLLAIPGDFMQTIATRMLNGMNPFGGVDFYFKTAFTSPGDMAKIATQSGFVMDEVVMATYGAARFTNTAAYGPALTRRISDVVMRASFMSGHTKAARWSVQAEFMGLMSRMSASKFDDLPFKDVMTRYGIDEAAWDEFRQNVKPWQPKAGVNFLRPIDILQSNVGNKDDLYRRFQSMVFEESRKMVPEATTEGSVYLKNTTRPDTLVGALLTSFAMFKNFPVSMMMIYGRLAFSNHSNWTRTKFIAGLAAGMTLVGALGTQMREVAKGRDPLPMDTPGFWGKAFLSGGGASIYGDFLFSGINEYGRGPEQAIAGPLVQLVGDTADLALGDIFAWADHVGGLGDSKDVKFPAKAVQFAKRYTPGTSIWWARLALERQLWDRLEELADPRAYQNRQRRMKNRRDDYGQNYWWAPGDRLPDQGPSFEGVVR